MNFHIYSYSGLGAPNCYSIVLLFVAVYVILFLVWASIVTVKIDSLQLHRLKNFGSGGQIVWLISVDFELQRT